MYKREDSEYYNKLLGNASKHPNSMIQYATICLFQIQRWHQNQSKATSFYFEYSCGKTSLLSSLSAWNT